MHSRKIAWLGVAVLLAVGLPSARAQADAQSSPALCGPEDNPEPGIQGDVPGGTEGRFNCGLTLVGELPISGELQGFRHCAYVRSFGESSSIGGSFENRIWVIDVSDPTNPRLIAEMPAFGDSETMRAVATDERAVLVFGAGVYDISDCENPVVKGQIPWPGPPPDPFVNRESGPTRAHDLRVSHDATKVYACSGALEADITNLDDPTTWTVREFGGSCHGPDTNGSDTRLYIGSDSTLRVLDLTVDPPQILDETTPGYGHSIDWFRIADGREYVLHASENALPGTTCMPDPRPSSFGRANEVFLTEVTGDTLRRVSTLRLAISEPENCEAMLASQPDGPVPPRVDDGGENEAEVVPRTALAALFGGTSVSYHSVDNPFDASFAMVPFGDSGLRVFDIRNPEAPIEVAYFNHGRLVHEGVSHYDAARGLIYIPDQDEGFQVLEIQPQVREALGLDQPDEWRPGDGRPPWAGKSESRGRPR